VWFYFRAVKAKERIVEKAESENRMSRNHAPQFIVVRDSRNRKVRALWQRSGRFYLQFRLPGERSARRVPLQKSGQPVANLSEAMEARAEVLHDRRDGEALPLRGRKPVLSVVISEYIGHHRRLAEHDDARRKTSLAIGKDSILDAG
jgi:hypothetical protein